MSHDCDLGDCTNFQWVVIRQIAGGSVRVCVEHFREALDAHDGRIRAFSRLECPPCCRPGCGQDAVRRAPTRDGSLVPVCMRHYDDLSWIDIPDLLSDLPGWSGG